MLKQLIMIALVLCVVLGSAAGGTISIRPASPTSTDSITVKVRNVLASQCWSVANQASCSMVQPDTLVIQVSVNYCGGLPSCWCPQFPFQYDLACTFAPLAAGTYVARFVEFHVNPADPLPSVTMTAQFTVSESTPTLRRSWGVLKVMYR